jgi:NAD(P)-dependent dehydrogenase (short-subunit alcohol dehydrogenase family)
VRALVTGSSYGIGAATAERLASEGMDVVLTGRTATRSDRSTYQPVSLEETAERVAVHGTKVATITMDLGDAAARESLVARAAEALGGPIDVLVNNAAAGIFKDNVSFPLRHRRVMFEVNLHAPIDLMQQAIPAMQDEGQGWIVNVTSGVARAPVHLPAAGFGTRQGIYGATKAALDRITVAFAAELAGTGVRVNAVAPTGAVMSEGAAARGMDFIPASAVQPMTSMVDSILWLCRCPAEDTGGVHSSLRLLEELDRA